ncbi:MAG: polyprenol monophosphomannose synthase [Patescibacteria group bacterium]|jgi:dolichol-phosphate mannosyltransferase
MPNRICLVIPTYNEAANIKTLLARIFALKINELSVIIVDDGSPDGTGQLVSQLMMEWPIFLISRPGKLGLGTAYIVGFQKALALGAELIFGLDADLSHDPAAIPEFLSAAESADLVIGSRRVAGGRIIGWNGWRHFCSAGAMWFARTMLNLKTRDVTSGYRCYRRVVLEKIDLNGIQSNGYAFLEEVLYRVAEAGWRIKEIPIVFHDRRQGQSKLSGREIFSFFLTILRLKFSRHD